MAKIAKKFTFELPLFEKAGKDFQTIPSLIVSGTGYEDKSDEDRYTYDIDEVLFKEEDIYPVFRSFLFDNAHEKLEDAVTNHVAFIFGDKSNSLFETMASAFRPAYPHLH